MAKTSNALRALRAAAGSNVSEALYVGAEANPRHSKTVDGKLEWGAGGASALDTDLYRDAIGSLKTDGIFQAGTLKENGTLVQVNQELEFSKGGVLTAPYTSPFRRPIILAATIVYVYVQVNTAPTGATLNVDILKNGTTIFTTQTRQPRIAISAFSAQNTSAIEVNTLAPGDYLQVAIDQVGSTIAGSDLVVIVGLARL